MSNDPQTPEPIEPYPVAKEPAVPPPKPAAKAELPPFPSGEMAYLVERGNYSLAVKAEDAETARSIGVAFINDGSSAGVSCKQVDPKELADKPMILVFDKVAGFKAIENPKV